jgi:hypothetical protein
VKPLQGEGLCGHRTTSSPNGNLESRRRAVRIGYARRTTSLARCASVRDTGFATARDAFPSAADSGCHGDRAADERRRLSMAWRPGPLQKQDSIRLGPDAAW